MLGSPAPAVRDAGEPGIVVWFREEEDGLGLNWIVDSDETRSFRDSH